jgi:hypothetical protein
VQGNDIVQYVEATGTAAEICFRNNTSTGDNIRIGGSGNNLTFDTGGSESARFDSSGNFKFNSGYGSVGVAYGVRAWVNFNGTGTVSIRSSGNASSITDNGTGDYTVNFTNAMPDGNYCVVGSAGFNSGSYKRIWTIKNNALATTSVRGQTGHSYVGNQENEDCQIVTVAVFR